MNTTAPHWKEHYPNLSFEELVCMYINDCMQYLDGCHVGKVDLSELKFDRTNNQDIIYFGLRYLKDKCMQIAGNEPLDWKDS